MNERYGIGTDACISYATDRLACSLPQTRWTDDESSQVLDFAFLASRSQAVAQNTAALRQELG